MCTLNKSVPLVISLCLACSAAAQTEVNSKARVAAFARLPNWSGVWERFDIGPGGGPTDPKAQATLAAALAELRPPYNETWQAKYKVDLRKKMESKDPGPLKCDPLGFPEAMLFLGDMLQFSVVPEETTIMFYSGGQRHVATDGQPLPPEDERWGSPWGQSVGHWEGQVLVIDTVSFTGAVTTPDREDPGPRRKYPGRAANDQRSGVAHSPMEADRAISSNSEDLPSRGLRVHGREPSGQVEIHRTERALK
jgi:hypothetical protein